MAFPGRLNEKKNRHWGAWALVAGVLLVCGWIAWEVKKTINQPLPPPQKQQRVISIEQEPGLVTQKADAFTDDVGQIRKGNIRKRAPKRVYRSGTAVEYSADPADSKEQSDYYSGR